MDRLFSRLWKFSFSQDSHCTIYNLTHICIFHYMFSKNFTNLMVNFNQANVPRIQETDYRLHAIRCSSLIFLNKHHWRLQAFPMSNMNETYFLDIPYIIIKFKVMFTLLLKKEDVLYTVQLVLIKRDDLYKIYSLLG